MKTVVDSYFAHTHSLRVLEFVHKPTFMRALDRGEVLREYGEATVFHICALGARYCVFQTCGAF